MCYKTSRIKNSGKITSMFKLDPEIPSLFQNTLARIQNNPSTKILSFFVTTNKLWFIHAMQ